MDPHIVVKQHHNKPTAKTVWGFSFKTAPAVIQRTVPALVQIFGGSNRLSLWDLMKLIDYKKKVLKCERLAIFYMFLSFYKCFFGKFHGFGAFRCIKKLICQNQ